MTRGYLQLTDGRAEYSNIAQTSGPCVLAGTINETVNSLFFCRLVGRCDERCVETCVVPSNIVQQSA